MRLLVGVESRSARQEGECVWQFRLLGFWGEINGWATFGRARGIGVTSDEAEVTARLKGGSSFF